MRTTIARFLQVVCSIAVVVAASSPAAYCDTVYTDAGSYRLPVVVGSTVRIGRDPFSVRHPKLHRVGRKIRRTCQILMPVVSFAGAVAQVVTAVR